MTCNQFVELITEYLDRQLDGAAQRQFAEHLLECAPCDRYLDQIRATVRALRQLPSQRLSPAVCERLLVALRDAAAP